MSIRVMIVDDAAFMRMMIKNIIVPNDCVVVCEATNGREAIEKYDEYKPDIVTMDITMPEISGIDAVKAIIKKDPQAKIIMCSAMGQEFMVVDAIKSGAKDFLVKPFQSERVIDAINRVYNNVWFNLLWDS